MLVDFRLIIFMYRRVLGLTISMISTHVVAVSQVLGIPWDVDTKGLKEYMSKFGELEDCVVMKVLHSVSHYFYAAR